MPDEELERFKTQINLVEVASSHGYVLLEKESSPECVFMSNPYRDKIMVAHNEATGHWMYFNLLVNFDKGTVIDFLQNRDAGSLGAIRRTLRPWLHSSALLRTCLPPLVRNLVPVSHARAADLAEKARVLLVEERPKGEPTGDPQFLDIFLEDLPLPEHQPHQKFTADQMRHDPATKRVHYGQLVAEQKRGDALDRIGEDLKAGRNISADDLRKLSRDDLEGLKRQGDDYLKQLIQERQQQRTRDHERER